MFPTGKNAPGYYAPGKTVQSLAQAAANNAANSAVNNIVLRMPITFTAVAGQTSYTVADVPDFIYLAGKTLKFVSDDSTVLPPANRSWDGITFSIIGVDVAGGEDIVIFAK